jgi:hypothetical protein
VRGILGENLPEAQDEAQNEDKEDEEISEE